MKRIIGIVIMAVVAIVLVSIGASQAQTPVGTSFTYQGRIFDDAGDPVNGLCYFIYAVFDEEIGGSQLDEWHLPLPNPGQSVVDGYFTSYPELDCATCWNSDARWLEIRFVCPYPTGPLQTLPRQRIYAVPYAIHSLDATVTPQPMPTLVNTATPQPTPTLVNTATPQPTPTLVNTATPQPTPTVLANVAYTNTSTIFTGTIGIDEGLNVGAITGAATGQIMANVANSGYFPFAPFLTLPANITNSTSVYFGAIGYDGVIRRMSVAVYVATTNDAANYWRLDFKRFDTGIAIFSVDTSAISTNIWTVLSVTGRSDAIITSMKGLYINAIKVNSPGAINISGPALYVE